jgi:DNA mismatch repair protein MutS2
MEFDTTTLQPTYRLLIGTPGNSYAFELLDRFGFEKEIIGEARNNLGEERGAMTRVIEELEQSLGSSRRLEEELAREKLDAERERGRLEQELATIRERRASIVSEAKSAAERTLEQANSLIENTLREIRAGASNEAVREMRRQIDEQRRSLAEIPGLEEEPDDVSSSDPFRPGDSVKLREGQEIGELETNPDEKGNVVVQFGPIRMRSHVDDLERVSGRDKREKRRSGREAHVNPEELQTRIDLRGRYADEISSEIEGAIAAALGSHLTRLEIIHGKGTGALRRATHDLLKSHPRVSSFRLGGQGEGGAGVTIVELD